MVVGYFRHVIFCHQGHPFSKNPSVNLKIYTTLLLRSMDYGVGIQTEMFKNLWDFNKKVSVSGEINDLRFSNSNFSVSFFSVPFYDLEFFIDSQLPK